MAKDPAFLFYPGDASEDVSHMNRLERGAYFDVIQAQKKFGPLSLVVVKKILGKDFDSVWDSLKMCLTYEKDMYYIAWLQESIEKRKKYSASRAENRKGQKQAGNKQKDSTYVRHMEIENGNGNVIEDSKYIMVENQKILDPLPVLEFYEAQLNGTQKEFNNLAWRPLVPEWFGQHIGEEFTDALHVKNSFKKFYLNYRKTPNGKQPTKLVNLDGL